MGAELQGRSYYGKHDESSVIDFLQQEGSVEETANLNELLYRLEASVSPIVGTQPLLRGRAERTRNEYRGFNCLLVDNARQRISMADAWPTTGFRRIRDLA